MTTASCYRGRGGNAYKNVSEGPTSPNSVFSSHMGFGVVGVHAWDALEALVWLYNDEEAPARPELPGTSESP